MHIYIYRYKTFEFCLAKCNREYLTCLYYIHLEVIGSRNCNCGFQYYQTGMHIYFRGRYLLVYQCLPFIRQLGNPHVEENESSVKSGISTRLTIYLCGRNQAQTLGISTLEMTVPFLPTCCITAIVLFCS